jgi:virulence-associated protein VapD
VGKRPLRMPDRYKKPTFESNVDYSPTTALSSQNWSVWIDRTGVTTKNGSTPKFMDRFLVVDEKDNMIHIVSEDASFSSSMGEFMTEPQDYGWVDKSVCVLSPNALYSSKTNFRMKIMTITTPEQMMGDMERIKDGAKKLAFFDTPTATAPNDKETPLFEFFYILKKEGNRYMVCKKDNISRGRSVDFVNGWVDIPSVQLWDQRQALEPNWDPEASRERQKMNVRSSIFSNEAQAKRFAAARQNGDSAFWNDDRYTRRYSPYWKRLPIFNQTGNIVETAVVSDLVIEGNKGDTVIKKVKGDDMLKIQEMLNEQIDKARRINLVFVIDGTQSMDKYFGSVRRAVLQSASAMQNSVNIFRYGAVIYRDYEKPDRDSCYLVQRLTDYGQFTRFINSVDANDKSCWDQSTSEGMYLGLKKVENVLRGFEKQTNIIILIGDSGDREGTGRITEADVMPMLKQFNCSILAMQVHNNTDQSYEDFRLQVRDLGLSNAQGISDILKQKYGTLNLTSLNNKPRWIQNSNGNRTLFNLQFTPVNGAFQYVPRGQEISPEVAEAEVKRIITLTDIRNDSLITGLRKLLTIVPEDLNKESGLTQEAIQLLMKAGFSADQINILRQKNYQFMLRGMTPIKVDSVASKVYNYVLFLDQVEFDDLQTTLNKIFEEGQTAYKRREKLKNSWQEILRLNYGATPEEIADKSLAELMKLITGLPSLNPLLNKYKMNDLTDVNKVSDAEFDDMVNDIKKKRDGLIRLSGNKEFLFLSNDRAWYWIPQSYLP